MNNAWVSTILEALPASQPASQPTHLGVIGLNCLKTVSKMVHQDILLHLAVAGISDVLLCFA